VTCHTFLFVDLVGFTALAAERGDDRAAEVALELVARVRALAPRHGAEVVKTLGDGVMLRAGEADDALRLGTRIVCAVAAAPELPPVRVGLHTGPAVSRGGDWYGTTVNVAARLCSAAAGGEVLASEATLAAAGRVARVSLAGRRLHWLKNVTEPIAARVATERPCPAVARPPAARRAPAPVIA
jgi:adenylate cyclase